MEYTRPHFALLVGFAMTSLVSSIHGMGDFAGEKDSFPGWLGSTAKHPTLSKSNIDVSKIIELSAESPRAFLYKGFLSEQECDHIISLASPRLARSSVVNNENGGSLKSEVRTSSGMFLRKSSDKTIQKIEERVAEWTRLPVKNQEPLQVLRYDVGQKYMPHFDYFHDTLNKRRGGHRFATVLMYLNNVTKGGETVFPTAKDPTPKDDSWSDCAKGFLAVKPQKGDALLFFDMHPDGTPDESSLHYACPVIEGVKWSAPFWIHVAEFNKMYKDEFEAVKQAVKSEEGSSTRTACEDTNLLCRSWAFNGHCGKESKYMNEACRKSCGTCSV